MAYKVTFERLAEADLEEIVAYLSARSPQGAENVARDIFDAVEIIATYPYASRRLTGRAVRYRSTRKYKYRLFFEIAEAQVRILSIRHPRSGTPDRESLP